MWVVVILFEVKVGPNDIRKVISFVWGSSICINWEYDRNHVCWVRRLPENPSNSWQRAKTLHACTDTKSGVTWLGLRYTIFTFNDEKISWEVISILILSLYVYQCVVTSSLRLFVCLSVAFVTFVIPYQNITTCWCDLRVIDEIGHVIGGSVSMKSHIHYPEQVAKKVKKLH